MTLAAWSIPRSRHISGFALTASTLGRSKIFKLEGSSIRFNSQGTNVYNAYSILVEADSEEDTIAKVPIGTGDADWDWDGWDWDEGEMEAELYEEV